MQIHLLKSGEVRVFSRNCEDRSQAFPDVATAIRTAAEGEPDLTALSCSALSSHCLSGVNMCCSCLCLQFLANNSKVSVAVFNCRPLHCRRLQGGGAGRRAGGHRQG